MISSRDTIARMRRNAAALSFALGIGLVASAALAVGSPSGPPAELAVGSPSGPPAELAAPSAAPAPGAADAPVPVPEPDAKALAYYRSGNWLWAVGQLWNLAVPLLVLASGLSARMRSLAARIAPHWLVTVVVFAALYRALDWLLARPLAFYGGYVRPHAYGLSAQTLEKWLRDSFIGLGVSMLAAIVVAVGLYVCIRRFPRRWWLAATAALVPFLLFVMLIQPLWVAPLFNDFGPMKDPALEAKILALAGRAGIEGSRVFEVNKSIDTHTVNAYVTGFLASKRIVLWDTLLAKLEEPEVLFVMAHEMGHYVLNHVLQGVALATLLAGLGLYAVQRVAPLVIRRFRERLGFERVSDAASLPLLLLLLELGTFAFLPVGLAFSRHMEHDADRFALELTRDSRSAALAFVKLQQTNLGIPRPGPLFVWWRGSHPTLGERIDFANQYRPWETGEPLRHAERFR
jgi:Zn-dependent protease with chaperone function